MGALGANVEIGSAPPCLQRGGGDTGAVLRPAMRTGGFGAINCFFIRKEDCDHHVMLCWCSFWLLWISIYAMARNNVCTVHAVIVQLLLERLLGLRLSRLSPRRAGTYQREALMLMEKLLQSEAVSTACGYGTAEHEEWGKAALLAEELLKSFLFWWNNTTQCSQSE